MPDYLQPYRSRLRYSGYTIKDRVENQVVKDFDDFLKRSPAKEKILVGSTYYYVVIQRSRQEMFYDSKIILAHLNTPLHPGSIFVWKESAWLIVIDEMAAREGYNRLIARKCDFKIKWHNKNNNDIYEEYMSMYKTSTTLGNLTATERVKNGLVIDIPIGGIALMVPNTSQTKTIDYGHRFVIDQTVWVVDNIDAVSSEGLIHFALSRTNISPRQDDINGQISKVDFVENIIINETPVYRYTLSGPASLVFGEVYTYNVEKYDNTGVLISSVYTFTISNSLITIIQNETTNTSVKLQAGNTLGTTVLTVGESGITVLEKTIRVIGFQ